MGLKIQLVRDGNSWAVRLPKAVMELSGIGPGKPLELQVKEGRIIIKLQARTKKQ